MATVKGQWQRPTWQGRFVGSTAGLFNPEDEGLCIAWLLLEKQKPDAPVAGPSGASPFEGVRSAAVTLFPGGGRIHALGHAHHTCNPTRADKLRFQCTRSYMPCTCGHSHICKLLALMEGGREGERASATRWRSQTRLASWLRSCGECEKGHVSARIRFFIRQYFNCRSGEC